MASLLVTAGTTSLEGSPVSDRPRFLDVQSITPRASTPNDNHRHSSAMRPFRGIWNDIKSRAPYYVSDWTDAWNYRVVPATAMIFFSNILPGLAFSLDLIETTAQYGVCEVLLSTFMAAFVFSIFGAQPLCIAGVTGPITVFNKTIYTILEGHADSPNYLHFIGWVYLWSAIMHWVSSIFNICNFLKYVTLISCDTFGYYVSWVYLQYGVQVITRQFGETSKLGSPLEGPYVSIILALLMLVISHLFISLSHTTLFHRLFRRVLSDYGMPITVIATSAIAYWGRFNAADVSTLPTSGAFEAAGGREWLVRFWKLEAKWVGIAFPFGFILTVLFLFDHNVSSLMAQGSEFPLRKPPGFHWDFFLLGVTTFIAGLLGLPAPNGLIPQAPIHTQSLVILGYSRKNDSESQVHDDSQNEKAIGGVKPGLERPIGVVEQRVSNLVQGSLCLVLMTKPFLHVLNLIPRGVLAGLFWFMGSDALLSSGLTHKMFYLIRDASLTDPDEPLRRVRPSRIVLFLAIELVGFGATMAITQTIAAIGFPIVIFLMIPLRIFVIPKLPFSAEELAILDGPTASPFTMASVGGSTA